MSTCKLMYFPYQVNIPHNSQNMNMYPNNTSEEREALMAELKAKVDSHAVQCVVCDPCSVDVFHLNSKNLKKGLLRNHVLVLLCLV